MIDWDAFYAYDCALANCAWLARAATNTLVARLAGLGSDVLAQMQVDGVVAGEGFGLDAEALLGADVTGLAFMGDDELEAALKTLLPRIVSVYGDAAALTALEFYREQRASHSLPDYTPTLAERIPDQFIIEDVDRALETVRRYASEGQLRSYLERHGGRFATNLGGHVQKLVMKSADETTIHNVNRDPANPRWAFVARPGACGWCVMVSSNGWRYRSEASGLRQRHTNCYCPVVADFDTDNPDLEGYDPKWMQRAYAKCLDTVSDDVARRWDAMTEDERSRYKGKWEFERNEVVAEMNRRDREWLRTGKAPEVDKSYITGDEWKKLKWYERDTWEKLAANHGIAPSILPEDSDVANIDAWYQREFWELKNPGDGRHSLEDLVDDAIKKWRKLGIPSKPKIIISNVKSSRTDKEVLEEALRRCKWYGIGELLFMTRDGEMIQRFLI